ncbi:hypothetical protein AB6A40_003621 [Gnathostoma spinigerum]|uniref:Phospholipid/glycerol acyltransferase domain-containing protein n=1 Tax=Gnathostoma spinigerum TaxID=75299 RepID=A0ABD6EK17_9BILA
MGNAIEIYSAHLKISSEAAECYARKLLEEMAHRMQMTVIRLVGYTVVKTVNRIFDGVFVNAAQFRELRELSKNDNIIFIPTHRAYMDFLLVSLLCYGYDVPLPAIAAGMDFMHSKVMGETLRRCGAFFIRRHFGADQLYWALFTEYVQSQLVSSDYPIEFFIEGTRSRSGKSLFPKYGLLQVLMEPFFRKQIYNVVCC